MCEEIAGVCEEISIGSIRPTSNPTRVQTGELGELVESIRKNGLLQEILVRPSKEGYEVVAGNRRLAACKMLRFRKIPCHVVEMDDREAYEAALVENVQRKTLDPFEEADSFKRYVDDYGYGGVSELAKAIAKSQEYVSRTIHLLDIPRKVREELIRRRISTSISRELLSLKSLSADELLDVIQDETLTVKDVRRIAKDRLGGQGEKVLAPAPLLESYYASKEREAQSMERVVNKCIAILKISMGKFNDVISGLPEDDWVLRETLTLQRSILHRQIDDLISLKKKMNKNMSRTVVHLPPQ